MIEIIWVTLGFLAAVVLSEVLRGDRKLQSAMGQLLLAHGVAFLVFWSGAFLVWFGIRSHLESSILLNMLALLRQNGPQPAEDLVARYERENQPGSRLAELARGGLVETGGQTVTLTPKGKSIARGARLFLRFWKLQSGAPQPKTGGPLQGGWVVLLGLLALMLIVKAWIFLSMTDVYFVGEEMARGTAAKAMIDGLPVPHYKIGHWYYEGGAFTVSHLTALAFLALGPSLLAHKLVALLFSAAILAVGHRLVHRSFGGTSAAIFGLLYIFGPVSFQKLSLLNIGTHYGALLFLALVLHFGMCILFDEAPPRRWRFVALGLSAGYAVYFSYQSLPLVAYVGAAVMLCNWRRLLSADLLLALGGFMVGLLPFLVMWSLVGVEIFNVHGQYLLGGTSPDEPAAQWDTLAFFRAAFEGMGPLELAASYAYLLLPAVALLVNVVVPTLFERQALRRVFFLWGYLGFFALVYLKSSFTVSSYYHYFSSVRFSPFWFIGLAVTAGLLGGLMQRSGRGTRSLGLGLVLFLLASGVQNTARALSGGRPFQLADNLELVSTTRGYSYVEYLPYFVNHLEGSLVDQIRVAMAFDEEDPEALYPEIVQILVRDRALLAGREGELFDALDPERRREFLLGLGPYLLRNRPLPAAVQAVRESPIPEKDLLFEALGRWLTVNYALPGRLRAELSSFRELDLPLSFYRGYGHRIYLGYRLDPSGGRALIAAQEPELQPALLEGFERARALATVGPPR